MDQSDKHLKPRILIAPLDWGLGHATRCIPLAEMLLKKGAEVLFAGSGHVKKILQQEFPSIPVVPLEGYGVSYSRSRWTLPFTLAAQVPKILAAIDEENNAIDEIVEEHRIDALISDNRFGLYHEKIPSVFMTHQLLIRTGMGTTADEWLQKLNYSFVNKFSECWVPDHENAPGLAGELSHPRFKPEIPLHYLGPVSRMKSIEEAEEKHILIVLSGPEPQRTVLEEMIVSQLEKVKDPVVLVRGLPGEGIISAPGNVMVYEHVAAKEMNLLMQEASIVISRCGYSTVMDLARLKKKSILIPTPGQTEQEYLSQHLMQMNFAFCIDQQKFNLRPALELSKNFIYKMDHVKENERLEIIVESFIGKLKEYKTGPG